MQGDVLAAGLENGEIKMFDLRSHSSPYHIVKAHEGKVMAMCMNGSTLVSGGSDSLIQYFKFAEV